ncbi:MAG: YkvA family protein [Xanthobacteraceae bacterium]
MAEDESSLRRMFWRKLKREVASVPFLEEVLTAHYCAFDRNTPVHVKAVLVGAIVYFVMPDDLIPDSIPIIGYADDAAVFGIAIKMMSSHIKPEHREAARRMVARLREG